MTATERYSEILMKILRCGHVKISDLQEKFQVSRSTIKRDIREISRHFPIRSVEGRYGGIFLDKDYRFGMKYLTNPQANLLEKISASLTGEDLILMRGNLNMFKKVLISSGKLFSSGQIPHFQYGIK